MLPELNVTRLCYESPLVSFYVPIVYWLSVRTKERSTNTGNANTGYDQGGGLDLTYEKRRFCLNFSLCGGVDSVVL